MKKPAPTWLKPLVEYGPIAAFFLTYIAKDLIAATVALMIAAVVAVAASLIVERRLPIMPLVTAGIVLVFGGLTVWLNDERFIKMKPTIVQMIFSLILFGGLVLRRPILKPLLQSAWQLDDRGWHILTLRFALFFAAMATLNEVVWRHTSTDVWVNFKVFGILALTIVFTMLQVPVIMRHQLPEAGPQDGSPPGQ